MSKKQYEPGTLGHMLRLPYTEPTHPASQESAGEAVAPHNPWREFIENCDSGDNYFRSSEYRELLEYIDSNLATIATLTAELAEALEQRDSLRDECERLRGDAARYHWLRDANAAAPEVEATFVGIDNDEGGCWIGCDLDKYIDGKMAALSASGREGAAPAIAKQGEVGRG